MNIQEEYRIGEIFRRNGETFQCVANTEETHCDECGLLNSESCPNCMAKYRSDKTDVYFIRVTEPKEGMLFRASDDKLYELKKLENFECGCYIIGYTNCTVISYEAFGEDILDIFHWYPVEENKEKQEEKPEMEEAKQKRHIELAVVKVEGDQVTFRIAEQTHRGNEFCKTGCEFKAFNEYQIVSECNIVFDSHFKTLYVIGRNIRCMNQTITVSLSHFAKIMEAVNEYNETDGNGYEKKFPEEGDTFYCITSAMTVSLGEFGSSQDGYEFKMRDAGNCFQTFEEAKAALERVKKALKGEYK